jgi:outer membrane translocation and assembly module TamA
VPLIWRLSAAGFVGYGDVADKLSKFNLNDFKVTGGLGIRYQIDRKSGTNIRWDFGFAKRNFGVYVMINEAF